MFKKVLILVKGFLVSFPFLCLSCNMLNEPVKEFFKEYTETAAIEIEELPEVAVVDSRNLKAVPSDRNLEITYLLRNPQKYKLNFTYKFDDEDIVYPSVVPGAEELKFIQSDDRTSVVLYISKNYLNDIDINNKYDKNLSGLIKIHEPKSGREFKSYQTELSVNTVPPEIRDANIMILTESSGKQTYVLCFNFPKLEGTVHEKDVEEMLFRRPVESGGRFIEEEVSVTISSGAISGTEFSTSAPSGTLAPGSAGEFNASSDPSYAAYYYKTGIKLVPDNLIYTLKLKDKYGLSSESVVGNHSPKLNAPSIKDASGFSVADDVSHTFIVDEDTGVSSIFIKESGKAAYYNTDGTVEKSVDVTGAALDWKVYDSSSGTSVLYSSGKSTGSAELKLPKGVYTIEVSQSKPYYVSSDAAKTKTDGIVMKIAPKYYVSRSGSDENTGKRNSPFLTIQKAIDEIEANESAGTGLAAAENPAGEIYLMSDIQITAPITFKSTDASKTKSYILAGYNGKRKISYAAGRSRRIVYVADDTAARTLTLKDLDLSGNDVDLGGEKGGVAYFNNNQSGSKLTVENCTISNNTISNTGNGGLIYVSGSLAISNSVISGNELVKAADNPEGQPYGSIFANGELTVSGKNTITGNFYVEGEKKTASNIYLETGKTLTLALSIAGSQIGVTTEDVPAINAPVNITTGFGAKCGTTKSSAVFTSDQGYVIGFNGKEAAIAVSSAAIEPELYENIEVRCGTSILYDPSVVDASGRTVSFKVYNKSTGKDVTDKANLSFKVKYLGSELGPEYVTKKASSVVFGTNVGIGFYYITVEATVNGTKYSSTHPVEIKNIPLATEFASVPDSNTVFGIASQEDMGKFADWVEQNARIYTVYLLKDITLSGFNTISKDSGTKSFTGTFNGNGHTITVTNVNRGYYQGLFYKLGADTTIKNLMMAGDISVDGEIGGFLKSNENNQKGIRIENCVNKMNITSTGRSAAGFIYDGSSFKITIINCLNTGNITALKNASGIANGSVDIYNCKNTGSISAESAGGITYNGTVRNCVNRGHITSTLNYAGGIAAYDASVINCINYGTVEGNQKTGGIVGYKVHPTIKNCVNFGKVISSGNGYVGAIIGSYGGEPNNINNNYFDSAVNEGVAGLGNKPTFVAPYAYPFTADGYASTVDQLVTLGSFKSKDVVSLLNEWVRQNSAASGAPAYSNWTYDEDGLPKLRCEE